MGTTHWHTDLFTYLAGSKTIFKRINDGMVHSVDEDRTWLQSSSVFIYNYVIEPIPTLITQTENIYKL